MPTKKKAFKDMTPAEMLAAEQRYNPHDTPSGAGLFPGLHMDTEWLKEQKAKKKASAARKKAGTAKKKTK